jgi:hypothetical protein
MRCLAMTEGISVSSFSRIEVLSFLFANYTTYKAQHDLNWRGRAPIVFCCRDREEFYKIFETYKEIDLEKINSSFMHTDKYRFYYTIKKNE